MVLGAGRGPLVSAALSAQKTTGIKIELYAIEKNPHCVIILEHKNKNEWKGKVEIIAQDMRTWKYPERAHIIISELLGSFGDNELSPECLGGAQHILRADGISIPCKYTSYLCPITYNCVYSRLKQQPKDFETPYVVQLLRHNLISNVKSCWSFEHPSEKTSLSSYNRYCKLRFEVTAKSSIFHGFAGYFDCVLYGDIGFSIEPSTCDKEMFAWFPMFFPVMNPIRCKEGDVIEVHLWRKNDGNCVWYVWALTLPILSQIHNPTHRSYQVDLQ